MVLTLEALGAKRRASKGEAPALRPASFEGRFAAASATVFLVKRAAIVFGL
jgi:hypothetical protein